MLKLLPNILTFARVVLTVVFLIMILYSPSVADRPFFLDIAFVIFLVAGLTDIVDGKIARKFNVVTKFGRMMDPLADKTLVCGAFICFAIIGEPKLFNLPDPTLKVILWSVAGILTLREVYVTVLRHIAEAHGVNFAAASSGKLKMFLQSFAIGTVLIKTAHVQTTLWGDGFTAVAFIVMLTITVISGFGATRRSSWEKVRKDTSA